MAHRSLWLAAYDIADPKRLRAVARCCEDEGRRIQQSVFLCHTTPASKAAFREAVLDRMAIRSDHLLLIPVCQRCQSGIEQHGVERRLPGSSAPLIL